MVRLIPVALALVSLSFHEAWATTPTAELQAFFADATLILTDPETDGKHAERLGAIRTITRQVFDIREAAKLSLGPAWRDRSEAERDEFVHLYGDFLERASYRVQVAAFKSFEAAMRLASLLRAEKPAAPDRWAVVMEPGPTLARVRVGPFADRAEAASNLRELESRGFKPFIAEESRGPR